VFTEQSLGFRRGITHGIPALIVLPLVLTGLILLYHRLRGRRKSAREVDAGELLTLSGLAMVTHPVLDWMNIYGMRWLMPFDGTWTYGDSLFIVDPWLYLLLGSGWLVARRLRRTREGARSAGERFARWMTGAATAYVVIMMAVTAWGRANAARELGLEHPTRRQLMVAPPFLASWRREVVVDSGFVYRVGAVNWLPSPSLVLSPDPVPKQLELVEDLPRTVPLEALLDWGRFLYAREVGDAVLVDDLRYARGGRSFAGVVVEGGRR
jgi:inner membrane protein